MMMYNSKENIITFTYINRLGLTPDSESVREARTFPFSGTLTGS